MRKHWLSAASLVLLTSCQTLDSALKSADSAMGVVNNGTMRNLAQIVTGGNSAAVLKQEAKSRIL